MKYVVYVAGIFLISFCIGLWGCTKYVQNSSPSPNAVDSFVKDLNGTLYLVDDDTLRKVDTRTGVNLWSTWLNYLFDGNNSPLEFDSGYVYAGSQEGVVTYNYHTGDMIWAYDLPAGQSQSQFYGPQELVLKDSLVYFTNQTNSFFGGGSIICLNKKIGYLLWSNLIDSNQNGFSRFNGVPLLANGNVITLTRGVYGHTQITAFNALNGRRVWVSADNDQLSTSLQISGDKIYSTSGQYAYCYSAKDGSMLWQTDMQFAKNLYSYAFIEQGKLIVARNDAYTFNMIKTLDATNGTLLGSSSLTVPDAADFRGYTYAHDILYVVDAYAPSDSLEITAYNITTQKLAWKYRYYQSSDQVSAVVTDKFVIFPSGILDSTGINMHPNMTFLNLNGSFVKKIPFPGANTYKFIYVDSTGIVFKGKDF